MISAVSRRNLFRRIVSFMILGTALPLFDGEAAKAQPKVSKAEAKYQDHPNAGHSCAICQFFHPPKTCQQVEGDVSPISWCSLWQQKRG